MTKQNIDVMFKCCLYFGGDLKTRKSSSSLVRVFEDHFKIWKYLEFKTWLWLDRPCFNINDAMPCPTSTDASRIELIGSRQNRCPSFLGYRKSHNYIIEIPPTWITGVGSKSPQPWITLEPLPLRLRPSDISESPTEQDLMKTRANINWKVAV